MSFKQLFFQSTLILFIIGFSSCEKEKIFIASEKSVNVKTSTSAKFSDTKTNKLILYVNKELRHGHAIKLTRQFLFSYNLSAQTDDTRHFIYSEAQNKFIEGKIDPEILIDLNTNKLELSGNDDLITENNSDNIDVSVFRSLGPSGIIGGVGTIISIRISH